MTQSDNILLHHAITHDNLNISISRKSLKTPMNTNELSSLTAKTKKKTINSIESKFEKLTLTINMMKQHYLT